MNKKKIKKEEHEKLAFIKAYNRLLKVYICSLESDIKKRKKYLKILKESRSLLIASEVKSDLSK